MTFTTTLEILERKQETTLEVITIDGNNGGQMSTQDKIINDLAIQLANKTIECANYKALYEEALEKIKKLQSEEKGE
jgi:hypothetical protein